MRGLFLKDLYIMRQSAKSLLFILIVWGIAFLSREGGNTMVITIYTIVGGTNFMNLFSCDKQTRWDEFMLSMPVMRKKAVMERYVFAVIMTILASVVSVAVVTAAVLIRQGFLGRELAAEIQFAWKLSITAGYFYTAIALPFIYWLGVEKARLIPVALLGILFCGFILLGGRIQSVKTVELLTAFKGLGIVLLSLVAMAVSCFTSIQIYEKKDF